MRSSAPQDSSGAQRRVAPFPAPLEPTVYRGSRLARARVSLYRPPKATIRAPNLGTCEFTVDSGVFLLFVTLSNQFSGCANDFDLVRRCLLLGTSSVPCRLPPGNGRGKPS